MEKRKPNLKPFRPSKTLYSYQSHMYTLFFHISKRISLLVIIPVTVCFNRQHQPKLIPSTKSKRPPIRDRHHLILSLSTLIFPTMIFGIRWSIFPSSPSSDQPSYYSLKPVRWVRSSFICSYCTTNVNYFYYYLDLFFFLERLISLILVHFSVKTCFCVRSWTPFDFAFCFCGFDNLR